MTVTVELTPETEAIAQAQAQAQGLTVQQWLLRLVEQFTSATAGDQPLSSMFSAIWADMPDEVRAKLPSDGADQHDHYIYGTPRKTP